MLQWIKNLNGKDIAAILSAGGGLILAGVVMFYFAQSSNQSQKDIKEIAGNHIDHSTAAIAELSTTFKAVMASVREDSNQTREVIRENTNLLKTIFNKK